MSDETMPEVRATSDESGGHQPPAPAGEVSTSPGAPPESGEAPRKRRRRGSRGGRNRRRPSGSADATAAETDTDDDIDEDDEDDHGLEGSGEDYTDASADRGLTSEDLAAEAKEDAGLQRRPAAPATPSAPQAALPFQPADELTPVTTVRAPRTRGAASAPADAPASDAVAEDTPVVTTGRTRSPSSRTRTPRTRPEPAAAGGAAAGTGSDAEAPAAEDDTPKPESGGRNRGRPGSREGTARPAPAARDDSAGRGEAPGSGRRSRPTTPAGSRPAAGETSPAEAGEPATTPGRRRRGRGGADAVAAEAPARGRAGTESRERTGGRGRGRGDGAANAKQAAAEAFLDDLDESVMEKRRGRTRKGRPTGRYFMAVNVRNGVIQVGVLEGRSLVEHYVSRPAVDSSTAIDGNIYLGKVQNVLPGMEAAFVDIGTPKNGVLYRDDVTFDESDFDSKRPKIERMLRNGQPVLVQVTKNPIGTKGARLTQEVSLAGRFVVMIPNQPGTYGISKRLSDDERKRLRKILDEIRPPDAGLIVRTAAEGASADELTRDMKRLQHQWEEISKKANKGRPAVLLHQEPDLAIRVIREEFNKEYRGIAIDDPELFAEVKAYVEAITPELADRVELYSDDLPIFERYHIHEQLHKALERKVWLPSGGSIIIERTEALTVIDVNTAKNVGRASLEETVFANNLEAAEEVARQLRLRDIGGIIVIDFIDMEIRKNREEVVRKFKEALARDKTRTQVFEISELGLVEMTRKRISEGLVEIFSTICTQCEGRGLILDHSLL